MADASLQIGNGNWAVKPSFLLGYNVTENGYNPVEMAVTRATTATRTNELGIIETKDSNVTRINYDGGVGSLLLEPQRTNLVTYSEDFSFWGITELNTSGTPPYINQGISPNGTLTADKIIPNIVNGVHRYTTQPLTVTSGVAYTFSVFMKRNDYDFLFFRENINGTYENTFFNLASVGTGTIGAGRTAIIKDYGNGWIRCSVTSIATSTSISIGIGVSNANNSISIIGDNVKFNYIWGAQLEVGSYPTSYIPTVASTVTRNADVVSKTGISDLINSEEGTLFIDQKFSSNSGSKRIGLFGTSSNDRILYSTTDGTSNVAFFIFINNVNKYGYTYISTDILAWHKFCLKWKNGEVKLFVDGILLNTSTTFTTFLPNTLNKIALNADGSNIFEGQLKGLQVYKTALTDLECQQLTTL